MSDLQAWFVEWAHGNGHAQAAGEARGHLDCAHRVGVSSGTSVLSAAKRVTGGGALRRVCRRPVCEVLCGQVRSAVADAGDLLPVVADRVFRGHRQRAWDRLAVGGLAGAAALCGHRAGRVHAGPLDDFAHAAADRCGHASRSVRLGTELVGGWWTAAGQAGGDRCDHAGSQRGDAGDRAARHGRELRGVLARIGEGFRPGNADPRGPGATGPQAQEAHVEPRVEESGGRGARIAKMKDGRTHLAHKAEHAVDLDTGAVVAVTLQGADQGDTTTLDETLCEAGLTVDELAVRDVELHPGDTPKVSVNGIEELVADKGYHSGAVLTSVESREVRSYIPEKKQKGRRHWQGKSEEQQAVYANRRRVRGSYGKKLLKRRGELVERSFAHCYETGAMRRTHLRGHQNILKRQLIHVGGFNLSLVMRKMLGAGTPRELKNRLGARMLQVFLRLLRRNRQNRLHRVRIFAPVAKYFKNIACPATSLACRKSATCTTGC